MSRNWVKAYSFDDRWKSANFFVGWETNEATLILVSLMYMIRDLNMAVSETATTRDVNEYTRKYASFKE